MRYELASRRFTKTWFDTKNDWANHPQSTYTCPHCGATTNLDRSDLERAIDLRARPGEQDLVAQLRQTCGWVWADSFDTVHAFKCSGCARPVLLGFKSSPYRVTGHMYRLAIVGEEPSQAPAP